MKVKAITPLQEEYLDRKSLLENQDDTIDSLHVSYYRNCVGVIRGEWFSLSGSKKLESICYGTAIALSKRVILTCAHSLYLEKKRRVCDNVSFILNQQQGMMKDSSKVYNAANTNFIKLEQLTQMQTFSKKVIPEQLSLVYLSEDLPLDDFPDIGLDVSLNSKQLSINNKLFISGYPSSQYYNKVDLKNINYSRVDLQGILKGMEANSSTLYHNMDTKTGHSGSAIFATNNQTQKPTVIGIHTHKGTFNNSGLLFTELLLKRLASYDLFFAFNHPQYDASIKLPLNIRTAAYEDLSRQNKDLISKKSINYKFYFENDTDNSDDENSEMDLSMFAVEYSQQIIESDQEHIINNNSIEIKYSKIPTYFSIQDYEVQEYQQIKKLSSSEQTNSFTKKSKTNPFGSQQKTGGLEKVQQAIYNRQNTQIMGIESISKYLKRINSKKQQKIKYNLTIYSEKIDLRIQNRQSNHSGSWEQFYQALYSKQNHATFPLRMDDLQFPFSEKQQFIRFQKRTNDI